MGETNKQVRVDNWGIFFLQRLQLFFNRTDYCDLTLQFEGNVQLKVHRLVMNACTEYFNILEHTCEVVDGNTIIMPEDLQADVILPIVNFMYTGMLEFQLSLFDKLYRTADVMNIPILLKLLDAQKKPITLPKSQNKKAQPQWNLHGKKIPKVENDLPPTLPGRKLPVWKRKSIPSTAAPATTHYYPETKKAPQDPLALFDNTPKPTRFEWPEDEISSTFNLMENSSFDDISYTSKPLLTQDDELRASTSFEEVKYTPNSTNKKSKEYNHAIDIDEVKNYVKEQKIRSDLVEYDDEDDPDNFLENVIVEKETKRKAGKPLSPVHTKRVKFSVNEKENKEAKINVTSSGKAHEMDHTKIISEVLKKYPHLIKKNKNIRLKILAKPTKSDLPKQTVKTMSKVKVQVTSPKSSPKGKVSTGELTKSKEEGPWICQKCSLNDEPIEFVLYYLYRKHMTDVHNEKFDCTMCKFCGYQSVKHNLLMYHQYTRHGIKPPPAYNFPKCSRCPYIALTETLLVRHKLNHTNFDLQCTECKVAFNSQASLSTHMQITGHTGKLGRNSYDCQYCTKRYHSSSNLFSHIKMVHRDEARRDGMVSIDEKDEIEDDQVDDETEEYILPQQEEDHKEKIKILSDIKVPMTTSETSNQTRQTAVSSHQRVTTNASTIDAGGIATSLGLVDIVVLDENQQYILHNDQQLVTQQTLGSEQREYIIPEMTEQHTFAQAQNINDVMTSLHTSDIASTDELVMVLTDHDYNDGNSEILSNENSNIVVLYSHPVDGQQNQFITSQGNLMLNSQTGLLELRNAEPHMNNTTDAQIESIEMIQREINSHNIISGTETVQEKPEYVTADPTTSVTYETNLTQETVILEKDFANNELITNEQQPEGDNQSVVTSTETINVDRMITLDEKPIDSNISEDVPNEVLIMNDCLNQEDEAMDIDEDCTVQENQNEIHESVEQKPLEAEVQQQAPATEHQQENPSKSMPEIDMDSQNPQELQVVSSHVQTTQIEETEIVGEVTERTEPYIEDNIVEQEEMVIDQNLTESDMAEHAANQEVQEIMESQDVIASNIEMGRQIGEGNCAEIQLKEIENEVSVNEEIVQKLPENNESKVEDEIVIPEESKIENQENVVVDESTQHSQHLQTESQNLERIQAMEIQSNVENVHIEEAVGEEIAESNVQIDHQQIAEITEDHITEETPEEITQDIEMQSVEIENNQNNEELIQIEEETLQIEEQHQHTQEQQKEDSQQNIAVITPSHLETESQIQEVQLQNEDVTSQIDETSSHKEDATSHINEASSHSDDATSHMNEVTSPMDEDTSHIEETTSHIEETTSHIEETTSRIDEATSDINQAASHIDETTSHIEEPTSHIDEATSHIEEATSHIEEATSHIDATTSHIDDVTCHIDENSVQNESIDENYKDGLQEETSQNSDKMQTEEEQEAVTSVEDENSQSQDSQTSQCSSKQEELLKNASRATKESILNDWEDTEDSQQSDNVTKKAEITVNKLIHDWDDDDEEGHDSES